MAMKIIACCIHCHGNVREDEDGAKCNVCARITYSNIPLRYLGRTTNARRGSRHMGIGADGKRRLLVLG